MNNEQINRQQSQNVDPGAQAQMDALSKNEQWAWTAGTTRVTFPNAPIAKLSEGPYIHPFADVDQSAKLGAGTKVWAMACIRGGVVLGEQCAVGNHSFIGVGAKLGNRVRIQNGVYLCDHTTVGDDVFIASHATTSNDRHPRVNNPHYLREDIVIKDRAVLGTNCTILPGVTIGEGAVVGAGAVVTKDVAPYTTVVGNPAAPLLKAAQESYAPGE